MKSLTLQRWLYEALRTKDAEAVREYLERGADVNITGNGQAPLHIAGQYGDTDTARLLLDAGADVNTKDQYGMTPLPYAARSGNPGEVRLLIEAGADVNARSTTNDTPLHYAAYNGIRRQSASYCPRGRM